MSAHEHLGLSAQIRFCATGRGVKSGGGEIGEERRGIDHPERKHEERERAASASFHVEVGEKIGFARTNERDEGSPSTRTHSLTHPSLNPFGRRQETEFRTSLPERKMFYLLRNRAGSSRNKRISFQLPRLEVSFLYRLHGFLNRPNSMKWFKETRTLHTTYHITVAQFP